MKRPSYQVVSIHAARRRNWRGFILQQKLDGRWSERTIEGTHFVGELMPDGDFIPFDCVAVRGQSIANEPTTFRLEAMRTEAAKYLMPVCPQGNGAEFLDAVLKQGGEGIVAKPADSIFGRGWIKVKVKETHDCVVIGKSEFVESVHVEENGIYRGKVPITGGKFIDGWDYKPRIAAINVGDIIEVACHSIHPSGKFREPRFVRVRDDKSVRLDA